MEGLLQDLDEVSPLVRAADGERLLVGERLFHLPTEELYQTVRERVFRASDCTPEILTRLGFRIVAFQPRLVADHAAYLNLMRKFAQMLQGPYIPRGSGVRKEIDDLKSKAGQLTRAFAPSPDLMADVHYRRVAEVHITRAGLRCCNTGRPMVPFRPHWTHWAWQG